MTDPEIPKTPAPEYSISTEIHRGTQSVQRPPRPEYHVGWRKPGAEVPEGYTIYRTGSETAEDAKARRITEGSDDDEADARFWGEIDRIRQELGPDRLRPTVRVTYDDEPTSGEATS
jgi:hypothetical protein